MKGNRYSICGRKLKKLVPFLEKEMKTRLNVGKEVLPIPRKSKVKELYGGVVGDGLEGEVTRMFEDICSKVNCVFGRDVDDLIGRVRHNFGHCQSDIYAIRTGEVGRIPDGVVHVTSEEIVVSVILAAREKGVCLIPFGGGTNVAQMLACPPLDIEPRPIISVDMRRMNKLLWIEEENNLACFQAGVTGRELVRVLQEKGYTMGHEPDSFEFSTLGGWVATKASGMKKNRYGNIEDIVRGIVGVDGTGRIIRSQYGGRGTGRGSSGLDMKDVLIGSEGGLAVITRVVVKIEKLPEMTEFDSVLFESFECGVGFMRSISSEAGKPVSIRLVDNEQFRLGMVMKGDDDDGGGGGGGGLLRSIMKSVALWYYGFDVRKMVGVTVKYEGSVDEVKMQRNVVMKLSREYGGLRGGKEGGKSGYELTFAIAYLRDFAMSRNLIAESFETFVNYSKLIELVDAVKIAVKKDGQCRGLCGEILVSARVTQLYADGACVYFYMILDGSGLSNASVVFNEIEHLARNVIMRHGGSLSHHHGIGKHRAGFLGGEGVGGEGVEGEGVGGLVRVIKDGLDPENIFGSRNAWLAEGVE